MAIACSSHQITVDTEVSILELFVKFTYQVPSFSVLYVDLRQVKIQVTKDDGSVLLFDGFVRADPSLERMPVPFSIVVKRFCFVPVTEFICTIPPWYFKISYKYMCTTDVASC